MMINALLIVNFNFNAIIIMFTSVIGQFIFFTEINISKKYINDSKQTKGQFATKKEF